MAQKIEFVTYSEVEEAKNIFKKELERCMEYSYLPKDNAYYMSPETIINCALAAVWTAGKESVIEIETNIDF